MDLESLVVGVIGMVAICMAIIDFVKRVSHGTEQKRAVVTQLLAWGVAAGVVWLYSSSDFGTFEIGGTRIDNMQWATKVILGLAIGSAAMQGKDLVKALDNSDSAKVPPLDL